MEQVNVIFRECDAGWIRFVVSAGSQSVDCRASELYDPFPQMIDWLESIAAGAEACSFRMDEEGFEKEFEAFTCANGNVRLIIQDAIRNHVLLEAQVDARQCVRAFYENLRSFVASPAYVPEQWEDETLSERLQKPLRRTEEELIEECCQNSAEELREMFFEAAPRYEVFFLDANSPEDEVPRFVEHTLRPNKAECSEGTVEVPEYYEFPEGFDYWLVDPRREFIVECLNDRVSSFGGCHLRALVSDELETWLGPS